MGVPYMGVGWLAIQQKWPLGRFFSPTLQTQLPISAGCSPIEFPPNPHPYQKLILEDKVPGENQNLILQDQFFTRSSEPQKKQRPYFPFKNGCLMNPDPYFMACETIPA